MRPGFVQALAACRSAFRDRTDPRFSAWAGFSDAGGSRAALLASVLGQDLTIQGLARLLRELREELGEDRLLGHESCPNGALARACQRRHWLSEWPHRSSLDGWVRAAMDFTRVHGDPSRWQERFSEPRDLVGALAMEIPWMGSGSPSRVKAWRLARWLVRGEIGPGWTTGRESLKIPVRVLERPLAALGWTPSGWGDWPRPRRQEWWEGLSREVDPQDPASFWLPLESILARGKAGPACQEHLGGCRRCPVLSWCPSPARS